MKPDNRTIVEKADIAVSQLVSNGGYLNTAQANTFIRMLQEQPTIVNDIRVVPMNTPQMEINKIGFASRILQAAPASGTALAAGKRSAPTTSKVTLSTKEVIAEVHIPYDVLEDNIERGALEDTIMAMIAERASLDIEELLILGDTGSGDEFLALMDGIFALATPPGGDGHLVDYSSTRPNVSKDVFKAGVKAMPNKYMRNRAAMKFYISPSAHIEWNDSLTSRETGLGDSQIIANGNQPYAGIPVVPAALMPDAKYLFTYPKNLIMGIQRQIMIETDRDIRARVLVVVLTMRLALAFEEQDSVVLCDGLAPNGTTTTT